MTAHLDPRALGRDARRVVGPWTSDQFVWLLAMNTVGVTFVFTGWWIASGMGSAHDQLGWLDLSVLGLVVAGGANAWWLARGRRVVSLGRAAVLPWPPDARSAHVSADTGPGSNGHSPHPTSPYPSNGARRRLSGVDGLVAGTRMSRYHRSSCLLVAGKQVRVGSRAEHERAGLAPCEVCAP